MSQWVILAKVLRGRGEKRRRDQERISRLTSSCLWSHAMTNGKLRETRVSLSRSPEQAHNYWKLWKHYTPASRNYGPLCRWHVFTNPNWQAPWHAQSSPLKDPNGSEISAVLEVAFGGGISLPLWSLVHNSFKTWEKMSPLNRILHCRRLRLIAPS